MLSTGCKSLTGIPDLPAGTQDISSFYNKDGAFKFYNAVVAKFGTAVAGSALSAGLVSDELHASGLMGNTDFLTGGQTFTVSSYLQADARRLTEGLQRYSFSDVVGSDPWSQINRVRGDAQQAIGIFAEYTTESPVYRGHLYAIIGYLELQLADMYCSGIPLSTVDFKGDWTYRAGSTTAEVYQHAIALFDTAMTLSVDSTPILNLARVGKGRALLALGRYADASTAVADVPLDFKYQPTLTWKRTTQSFTSQVTMVDREGVVGLPYFSGGDHRVDSVFVGTNTFGTRLYLPKKYPLNVASSFTIADGIEAQLIIAEAKLNDKKYSDWLQILNHLRQNAIVPALPDLDDPGSAGSDRVDTLFKERAFWMYLTGHRLGDMRRLIRQYGREPNAVYPMGGYPGWSGDYGADVVIPISNNSEGANPLFQGCLNYDA